MMNREKKENKYENREAHGILANICSTASPYIHEESKKSKNIGPISINASSFLFFFLLTFKILIGFQQYASHFRPILAFYQELRA